MSFRDTINDFIYDFIFLLFFSVMLLFAICLFPFIVMYEKRGHKKIERERDPLYENGEYT